MPDFNAGVLSSPGLNLLWTPFDPLDLAGGSMDPLGFGRGYIAIADRWLPDFTTITTVPRYLSMLCAALHVAEQEHPAQVDIPLSTIRKRRLDAIKSYERAWILACRLPRPADAEVRSRLRGISYVDRKLREIGTAKTIRTGSFNLLANQVRYGAIGTYSSFLEACHLAHMDSLKLRPLGEELAARFPGPESSATWNEEAILQIESLHEWGRRASPDTFTAAEAKILRAALRGGEEQNGADRLRWTALQLISMRASLRDKPEHLTLQATRKALRSRVAGLTFPEQCEPLSAALELIEPFERCYQVCSFLFDQIRLSATSDGRTTAAQLLSRRQIPPAMARARSLKKDLGAAIDSAATLFALVADEVRQILEHSGILAFVGALGSAASEQDLLERIVGRHREVQAGKFDQGLPKASWVRMEGDAFVLTSQRYQLQSDEAPGSWSQATRHPYRVASAAEFIRLCRIEAGSL